MDTMHYHVGHNMPGYLPDSEPIVVKTKTEAIQVLRDEKEFVLDTDEDARFYGEAVDLYYDTNFGEVYWADACFEPECEKELV